MQARLPSPEVRGCRSSFHLADRARYLTDLAAVIGARCRVALAERRLREAAAAETRWERAEEVLAELVQVREADDDLVRHRLAELQALEARVKRSWRDAAAPARALADDLGLSTLAVDILWLAAAPSIWGELGAVYDAIAGHSGAIVDEQLLGALLFATPAGRLAIAAELHDDAPLVRRGVVVLAGRRPCARVTVHPTAVRRLMGDPFEGSAPGDPVERLERDVPLAELVASPEVVASVAAALDRGEGPARLAVRGQQGTGRRTLAAALARAAGRPLGAIDLESVAASELGPVLRERLAECALRGWTPLLDGLGRITHDPQQCDVVAAALRGYPDAVLARLDPGPAGGLERVFTVVELPIPPADARERVWAQALAARGWDPGSAGPLAHRHPVGVGEIRRAIAGADSVERLGLTLRRRTDGRLGHLASRASQLPSWSSLVLPADLEATLHELVVRVREAGVVFDGWGIETCGTRGVAALFQGGPGTGKTLAASAIASALGYELYKVDLSRIASKWIGETQQNLGRVFDAAEGAEVVLLFDEADALFGRRTEVKSSNDRHANSEVDYLLSRLDDFDGVAILTTNFGASIDAAVLRRMTFRLVFPFPEEEERARLWRLHLPRGAAVDPALDTAHLAGSFRMSGAAIRRAVLRGLFLAAERKQPLDLDLLVTAIRREYGDQGILSENAFLE